MNRFQKISACFFKVAVRVGFSAAGALFLASIFLVPSVHDGQRLTYPTQALAREFCGGEPVVIST
ncbi:MAG: hypothetical protein WBK28_01490, partial [Minisyncoccia bacterium]